MAAYLAQINTSRGGVPKLPVESAQVSTRGVDGDEQADRVHHGSPDQALCLFSAEVIEALRKEGHPIHPGATGENLTISGLVWDTIEPGVRLRIGSDVVTEITGFATPCAANHRWFADGSSLRIHQRLHPGWSRVYGRVLQEGSISTGDPVEVLRVE